MSVLRFAQRVMDYTSYNGPLMRLFALLLLFPRDRIACTLPQLL
jgi:hypothetical protein